MESPPTNTTSVQVHSGPPQGRTLRSSTATTANQQVVLHPRLCRCNGLCWFAPRVERRTSLSRSASDRDASPASIRSEFSKIRFRPQIATVLSRSLPDTASKPAASWSFGSHLLQELPSPPPVFCHPVPVARSWLPEVNLVAKVPAGLISALFLEAVSVAFRLRR